MKVEEQVEKITRVVLPGVVNPIQRHSSLFPSNMRCLISGPSGSGKTDLMTTLLLHENGLCYKNVYIYSKTLHQEKYKLLSEVFNMIPEITYRQFDTVEGNDINDIEENSVVIFDDVITCKQNFIRDLFSFGRHRLIDVLYLVQTFTKIPKHLIRDNANVFVLFKQDIRNLRNFYNDNITDLKFQEFVKMCFDCWNDNPHSYIVINLECEKNSGRYRHTFDKFIICE